MIDPDPPSDQPAGLRAVRRVVFPSGGGSLPRRIAALLGRQGQLAGMACRSGYDYTDLEFYDDGGRWAAIVGHHASGENPRVRIGVCESLADVQRVYDTIRHINGRPQ
jgi:hypothetical protein